LCVIWRFFTNYNGPNFRVADYTDKYQPVAQILRKKGGAY
jgi:hypothetical protein